ncbi:MAG: polysaccharide pyruvyl transferase family protein, partial [Melioribacteraceae bacterium]|nr:polysaccharide pyruvyl transferase family protein [Melioribacteraceae bacterium]
MRILVTGQVTVHWGRIEFGNIGNYYITETTFRELHRVFPKAKIVTTFQMTDEFCKRENIECLPMELFYSWSENDLKIAIEEYGIAELYKKTKKLVKETPFISELLKTDLVLDFSGELWGDHAEPVGKNRFLIGLLKNRTAQLLGKKTVLLAGSQGPFSNSTTKTLAKEVLKNFDMVLNREVSSVELLNENGFDTTKVKNFTDPAFLFEPHPKDRIKQILEKEGISNQKKPVVGFILCGFNMLEGPYDKWPRRDDEFTQFAEAVEFIINKIGAKVVTFSHQNGFELPPNFKLINGRDYPYAQRLHDYVIERGNVKPEDLHCISKPYLPKEIKAIIKEFDMLVSGRIHGFVAGVSQFVPTVILNRGHGPVSKRNLGFAKSVG